jgi:hypothetical protein
MSNIVKSVSTNEIEIPSVFIFASYSPRESSDGDIF